MNFRDLSVNLWLFISAYTPLFLILCLKYVFNITYLMLCFVFFIVLNLLLIIFLEHVLKNKSFNEKEVENIENKTSNVLSYLLVFSISLLNLDLSIWRGWISLFILLIIIFAVFVRSDLLFLNPILTILGYKTYSAKLINGDNIVILSKKDEIGNSKMIIKRINKGFYIKG
jgi:hypothetical protein